MGGGRTGGRAGGCSPIGGCSSSGGGSRGELLSLHDFPQRRPDLILMLVLPLVTVVGSKERIPRVIII